MMGGQNVELSVARLNVCTVLHVKPGGARGYKGGGECPPAPPPKCNPDYHLVWGKYVMRCPLRCPHWLEVWCVLNLSGEDLPSNHLKGIVLQTCLATTFVHAHTGMCV